MPAFMSKVHATGVYWHFTEYFGIFWHILAFSDSMLLASMIKSRLEYNSSKCRKQITFSGQKIVAGFRV